MIGHALITVSADERDAFLANNPMPLNEAEGYIWFSFSNAACGTVELFSDELSSAAAMARKAGLEELAFQHPGLFPQVCRALAERFDTSTSDGSRPSFGG